MGIHTKVTQRFSCTECMETRKIRLKLIEQHRNKCLSPQMPNFKEEMTTFMLEQANKSPKEMGESLKAEYASDKTFKKLIKKDFKKRSNKKAKEKKNNSLDLITKVSSIIGIIAIIYMSTYIIVRATQEEEEEEEEEKEKEKEK